MQHPGGRRFCLEQIASGGVCDNYTNVEPGTINPLITLVSLVRPGMRGASVKKSAAVIFVVIILSALIPARTIAQVFYQFPGAPVVKAGEFATGPYFTIGDDEIFRLGGFARMNATKYFDVGAELLFGSMDGDGQWGGGVDIKFSLFPPTASIPFDLSATAGAGAVSGDAARIIQVPFGGIISSPFTLDNGGQLVPYLGVYMLIVDTKIKIQNVPDTSDTDIDVELRGGLKYTLAAGPDIFAAFHIGRDGLFMIGVNFWPKGHN
jgi:hypothetical protein